MSGPLDSILGFREGGGVLDVGTIVLSLLATFLLCQAVAWVYLRTHRGISYSGTMARSLIMLSLIIALVMLVIGNNVARAFGMFGALALIRFRTPVKDANDTVFLFFAVAIGIATGTGNIMAGAAGTLLIGLAYIYLAAVRFGHPLHHDGLLRFNLPPGVNNEDSVRTVLGRYCDEFSLLHVREADSGSGREYSYQIKMIDTRFGTRLITDLEGIAEVSRLSLLMQDMEATP